MNLAGNEISLVYPSPQGDVLALQEISFSIAEFEFLCIVGPSGCGKSTLLKLVAGLLTPTAGQINFDSQQVDGKPATAMVFQEESLYPWLNVLDNVSIGLAFRGVSQAARDLQATKILAKIGLAGFEKRYPHQLSGGMKQRVALARAFLSDPQVLLMDEPFGALDAQTRLVLQAELLRIWRDDRKTVLFVTHDIDEAIRLGDRILVMSGRPGRILQEFPIKEVRPAIFEGGDTSQANQIKHQIWNILEDEVRKDLDVREASGAAPVKSERLPFKKESLVPLLITATFFSLWEFLSRQGLISQLFFPAPSKIASTFGIWLRSGELFAELGLTLSRVVYGFLLGSGFGLALGLLMGWSRRLRAMFDPMIAAIHPIPKIAMLPLILILFGIGETSRIVIAAIGTFFPMLINSMAGVLQIRPVYFDVAANFGASQRQIFQKVVFPGSLPLVLTGMRLSLNLALMITVAVELRFASNGIGKTLWLSWETLRTSYLYAAMVVLSLLGISFNYLLTRLKNFLTPWHQEI